MATNLSTAIHYSHLETNVTVSNPRIQMLQCIRSSISGRSTSYWQGHSHRWPETSRSFGPGRPSQRRSDKSKTGNWAEEEIQINNRDICGIWQHRRTLQGLWCASRIHNSAGQRWHGTKDRNRWRDWRVGFLVVQRYVSNLSTGLHMTNFGF